MDHVITLSTANLLFALILHFSIYSPIAFAALVRNFTDIAARMDMVVILSQKSGFTYNEYQEEGYAAFHKANPLRIGEAWTQLAIVSASGEGEFKPRIVMNLTGDGTQFVEILALFEKERNEKDERDHVLKLADAFDLIRTEIFTTKTPGRAKVVFFMMTSAPERHMDTVTASKKLLDEGVLIYMMVKGKGTQASNDRYVAMNYTGDPNRVVVYKGSYFDDWDLLVKLIRNLTSNALYTDLCRHWNHKCQCNHTQGVCNESYVLSYLVGPIDEECRQSMPTAHIGNCTLGTTNVAMIVATNGIAGQLTITTTSALTPAEIFGLTASALFFLVQVTVAIALCTCFR